MPLRKPILHSQETLTSPHGTIFFHLKRSSRRKTLVISINEKAQVDVAAPLSLREKQIREFILGKSAWVCRKVSEIQKNPKRFKRFEEGEEFLFLGNRYPLTHYDTNGKKDKVILDDGKLKVYSANGFLAEDKKEVVMNLLAVWYRQEAHEILAGRIFKLARVMEAAPQKITIRTQKRLWGSCHYHKRSINLNWQIVMAPIEVIDYVIVHELCHLIIPNHSKRFWKKVERFVPHYRECQQWLKHHSQEMRWAL